MKIKKAAAEMSGRKGQISRQDALDHDNGDDYMKEERESCVAAERRTDVDREQRRQRLINSQAVESSLMRAAVDSSLNTSKQQRTVTVEVHRDTS